MKRYIGLVFVVLSILLISGCDKKKEQVVIYTSVDRVYSEQIFESFTEDTGIEVLPVYDVEATKTTGIVQRLIAEKEQPQADIFWNGEILYTMKLKDEGVLAPYEPSENVKHMVAFEDKDNQWIGFGGRARVMILKPEFAEVLTSVGVRELAELSEDYNVGLAKPMFGTTVTHVAAIYALFGEKEGRELFKSIDESNTKIVDGNSAVRDMVVSGQLDFGLTDTDDALGALRKGADVVLQFPDQGKDQPGTLVVPNTVGLIKGAANEENGKAFIEYVLKEDTIQKMIDIGWFQLAPGETLLIHDELKPYLPTEGELKIMDITFDEIRKHLELSSTDMTELFLD